jgi:hypothetical protein
VKYSNSDVQLSGIGLKSTGILIIAENAWVHIYIYIYIYGCVCVCVRASYNLNLNFRPGFSLPASQLKQCDDAVLLFHRV